MNKQQQIENRKQQLSAQIENALGFKIDIDTLTGIKDRVTTQKFYEVRPSEYMPVVVGQNAFSEDILTYKDYSTGSDFEAGIIQGSTNATRQEKSDVAIEGIKVPIVDWAKKIEYNLIELNKASKSGNWSLVESKERSRFRNWQLGIQKVAFLGLETRPDVDGMLTQTNVTSNTTTIPKLIKTMTEAEFGVLVENILSDYFLNSDSTAMPTHFVIPTSDFLGLGAPTTETYWNGTKIGWLTELFKMITGNADFKIMPLAYADKARNSTILNVGTGLNRYSLYRYDEESLRMDIPIDYTSTITDTFDGFSYQSSAYGEFTGAKAYREKEMLYFDNAV